jgi:hypothetical protein
MLVWKLTLAPALVSGVTLAGRRWGARVAGVLAGLPVVGGPILLLVTLEQGATFGARTAAATNVGLVATTAFCLVYAWSARRLAWPGSLALGWGTFVAVTWLLGHFDVGVAAGALLAVTALSAALVAMPRASADASAARPRWWDLPLRALFTVTLVVAVTAAARLLGPRWTGLLTPFPIATSVLAVFTHAQTGSATRLLRGLMAGFYGFVAFTTTVAMTVERCGIPLAFLGGLTLALAVNSALLAMHVRRD